MGAKKILLFTDSLGAGGAQRQLVGLAIFLQQAGYNVKVCTYYNFSFYKSILDDNQILNELIPNARSIKERILNVYRYFRRENPDWVIAYQETPSLVSCIVKLLGGKFRLIVSERNTTQHIGMNERIRFFLYRWADAIVPNSFTQSRFLLSHYPWMNPKIKTITNFVDVKIFCSEEHHRCKVPEILVVGSIGRSKNTKGFVEACKLLIDKKIKFHATWYGWHDQPTNYMKETIDLIAQLDLKNIVEIKNKTLDIARVYKKADYFCIPSFFEGTPNVLCEAISSGLPVAASNVCDNNLYVQDEVNGYLFDPSNIESISKALERLLSIGEHQYLTFRTNSRKIAVEKLSIESFVSKYCSILES